MLEVGDKLIRLHQLIDDHAKTAFKAFFLCRSTSIFDAPLSKVPDRGSNLSLDFVNEKIEECSFQMCPIATEAPWSVGNNERSHGYLAKVMKTLQAKSKPCNLRLGISTHMRLENCHISTFLV